MSSSTSASDSAEERAYGRWLATFVVIVVVGFALVYVTLLILDPYSTGRFTPLQRVDITTDQAIFSNAGRVRDPRFDSAIVGNSRVMRIMPEQLDAQTGRRFVTLAAGGLVPTAQIEMASAFAHHHAGQPFIMVWGLDGDWCSDELDRGTTGVFLPHWLYQTSGPAYLAHVLSPDAIIAAYRRVLIMLGLAKEPSRTDGYEPSHWFWNQNAQVGRLTAMTRPRNAPPADAPIPALDRLADALRGFDPGATVLLVLPPVFSNALPEPDTAADRRVQACKARIAAVAAGRPNTNFLDLQVDTPASRVVGNFVDETHYRDNIARTIEQDIARRLAAIAK